MESFQLMHDLIMEIRLNLSEMARIIAVVDNAGNELNRMRAATEKLQALTQSFRLLNPSWSANSSGGGAPENQTHQDQILDAVEDLRPLSIADIEEPNRDSNLRIERGERRERSRTRIRFTEEESKLILRLRHEGTSLREIADRINKTVDQVRYHWRWKVQRSRPQRNQTDGDGAELMENVLTDVQIMTPDRPQRRNA